VTTEVGSFFSLCHVFCRSMILSLFHSSHFPLSPLPFLFLLTRTEVSVPASSPPFRISKHFFFFPLFPRSPKALVRGFSHIMMTKALFPSFFFFSKAGAMPFSFLFFFPPPPPPSKVGGWHASSPLSSFSFFLLKGLMCFSLPSFFPPPKKKHGGQTGFGLFPPPLGLCHEATFFFFTMDRERDPSPLFFSFFQPLCESLFFLTPPSGGRK